MPVVLVHIDNIQVDYKTGVQTVSTTTYTIKRALRLPRHISNYAKLRIALGIMGQTERTIEEFIIDKMPVTVNLKSDYLIVEGKRFNIIKIVELENGLGWHLSTEAYEEAEQ